MRAAPFVILALLASIIVVPATSAFAGDVTVAGGQVTWKSTKCVAPNVPPSLTAADRLSPANDMNVLVTQYNEYTKQMHVYMSCMSDEAKMDADLVSQAVINSAQASIDETQKSVDIMGAQIKKQ